MHREFLMGNEAMELGALAAGVDVVAGYPGTPSTEVLDTIAKRNPGDVYVEWSVNEKAGLEVAAGAAYAGARALVTMKCVGLNVAADPLMSLEYIGVKGALVVLVADDPGPISSQTEQDTRTFAKFSKVSCLDPSGVADAYQMVQDDFRLSEEYHTPVFLRPTTRVDHGYEAIDVRDPDEYASGHPEGFVKDASKWVISLGSRYGRTRTSSGATRSSPMCSGAIQATGSRGRQVAGLVPRSLAGKRQAWPAAAWQRPVGLLPRRA